MNTRRLLLAVVNGTGVALSIAAALGIAVWLAGRVLSDRYEWSQWLLWIPTPAALAAALAGLLGALRPGGAKRWKMLRRIGWLAAVLAVAVYFAVIEHRLLSFRDCDGPGLRIVHWNASNAAADDLGAAVEAVTGADAEITILTNSGKLPWQQPVRQWLGERRRPLAQYPFVVLTKLPVLELRTVAAAEHVRIAVLKVDTTEALGRPLTMLLVDLPSDPDHARMETARRVRQWLNDAQLPEVDLYVGDFNLTRNSASLKTIAPGYVHAFNEAGTGYGATYPRELPWLHIDHMLLSQELAPRAGAYCLRDPGAGRHRMQMLTLRAEN